MRLAYTARHESDYLFTNPGLDIFLVIITCGLWGLYVFYQLMRRMRDHNRRRLELFDAATTFAWDQATHQGKAEELRPAFERVQAHLAVLRSMTGDFRDPVVWTLIALVAGIVTSGIVSIIVLAVGFIFLDGDLIKHDRTSGAIEAELREVYAALGSTLPVPDPSRVKGAQNYAVRIIVSILTCGIYVFWWIYNMMVDGNRVFEADWPWEDALATSVQQLSATG